MRKSQILSLFLCRLVPFSIGNGLIPLLPIYAKQIGGGSAVAGNYLAIIYIAVAAGTVLAGWISDKFDQRKNPIIIAGLAGIPLAWLIGRAENIWSLSIVTAILWFSAGLIITLIGILAGLSAGEDERGKIFGILSITSGLGTLIGCLTIGYIADRWGYPTMFATAAGISILLPLSGYFLTEKSIERSMQDDRPEKSGSGLGRSYYHLFFASLVASTAGFVIMMGRSFLMADLEYSIFEISITGVISGIVAMWLPLIMGWLSDRMGRKVFLYLGYLSCIISLGILAVSESLWQFILVLVFQSIFVGVNLSVGNALVTDLVHPELLGKGLARYGATIWIGGVLGFAITGYAIQYLGTLPTIIIGICMPLIAMVILFPVRSGVRGGDRIVTT